MISRVLKKIWSRRLFLVAVIVLDFDPVFGAEPEAVWSLSQSERLELQRSIENHRELFLTALDDALQAGLPKTSQDRPYQFDSETEVLTVPRSVLNRVVVQSLALELEAAQLYLFCENDCDRSLSKDLEGQPNKTQTLSALRTLWPKIKNSMALLWKDIPTAVWIRMVHSARYIRSAQANIHFQRQAYGSVSMAVGGLAFGTALGATELIEIIFLGPLHVACNANYLWSLAFGAAIASVSRDLKTLLLFERDGKSFARRAVDGLSTYRSLRRSRNLENRIVFENRKMSVRKANLEVLKPFLNPTMISQAVATDALLWAELTQPTRVHDFHDSVQRPSFKNNPHDDRETLFGAELEQNSNYGIENYWRDINASLHVTLRIFVNDLKLRHINEGQQKERLKIMGELDRTLRTLDLFQYSMFQKNKAATETTPWRPTPLRNYVSEWLSIAIETSSPEADLVALKIRTKTLNSIIAASVRRGDAIDLATSGHENLRSTLKARSRTSSSLCQALFSPSSSAN